jgi:predicted RNase H-like nuclease
VTLVLGVDGCRRGWCGVGLDATASSVKRRFERHFGTFAEVLDTEAEIICIDIPIGLLNEDGKRQCDVEAKKLLGRARPRVFWPPIRSALSSRTHVQANRTNRERSGAGLSAQAFGILPKICEVDHLMTPKLQTRVREVHPEICFWALAGGNPVLANKASSSERWNLLKGVLRLPKTPQRPMSLQAKCQLDDYIDALVAGWTAVCIFRRQARHLPTKRKTDIRGLRMEIWYPAVGPKVRRGLGGRCPGPRAR